MTGSRDAGQVAFFFGDLMELRQRLGLSKAALAEVLGVSTMTIYRWEGYGALARLNERNAERVDEFCQEANKVLDEVPDFRERYVTFAVAAQRMGVTQEFLFQAYRQGVFLAYDFGMLGLFVPRNFRQSFPRLR